MELLMMLRGGGGGDDRITVTRLQLRTHTGTHKCVHMYRQYTPSDAYVHKRTNKPTTVYTVQYTVLYSSFCQKVDSYVTNYSKVC